jgi:hypothetical protein
MTINNLKSDSLKKREDLVRQIDDLTAAGATTVQLKPLKDELTEIERFLNEYP